MCWGKNLLIQGLRRRIGNGQNTKVFTDPWLPRPASFRPITQSANDDLKVAELIQHPGKWNVDLIQESFLLPDSQLIFTIPLSPFNHTDSWLWHYTKNGRYSVKSGYNLAISTIRSGPSASSDSLVNWWKAFWAIKIPRKIFLFAWRGYHEILPTMKGLLRRNVALHSNCPLCGFGEDSNAHAVFWCTFSQKNWELMNWPFLLPGKENISFKEVMLYATELLEEEEFAKMLITSWGIWSERNKRIHGQQQRDAQQIKNWVSSYAGEVLDVLTREGVTKKEGKHSGAEQIEAEDHDYALFVDASISTSSQKVRLGAVIFTPNNRIQARLSKPLEGSLSVLHAEALALLVGLRWVHNTGLMIKRISTDSLSLVQALENDTEYYSEIGIFLADIRMLLLNYPGVTITHIRRKHNFAAHNMAKYALQLETEASWIEDID